MWKFIIEVAWPVFVEGIKFGWMLASCIIKGIWYLIEASFICSFSSRGLPVLSFVLLLFLIALLVGEFLHWFWFSISDEEGSRRSRIFRRWYFLCCFIIVIGLSLYLFEILRRVL